ncbi:14314_t:CDS:2 [Cetraspora pellucida]|uniref:14314_t:CDS:1 n=1 Tax=Cetraspora pellucida TaxID=1433469 RepID=A0ACA9KH87_9GLOM|nr:14314_t:CDS:2 [Cetraspora pellucida]
MITEKKEISELVSNCKGCGTIHLNNPPVYIKRIQKLGQEERDKSKTKLLKELKSSEEGKSNTYYEVRQMKELGEKIVPHALKLEKLKSMKENNGIKDSEMPSLYQAKEQELGEIIAQEINNYIEQRNKDQNLIVIDKEPKSTISSQLLASGGTTLIAVGGLFVNAFVPGLGSALSTLLIGLIPK